MGGEGRERRGRKGKEREGRKRKGRKCTVPSPTFE